jgi:hypothetical protein
MGPPCASAAADAGFLAQTVPRELSLGRMMSSWAGAVSFKSLYCLNRPGRDTAMRTMVGGGEGVVGNGTLRPASWAASEPTAAHCAPGPHAP